MNSALFLVPKMDIDQVLVSPGDTRLVSKIMGNPCSLSQAMMALSHVSQDENPPCEFGLVGKILESKARTFVGLNPKRRGR